MARASGKAESPRKGATITLLDLVDALARSTSNDAEVVAAVTALLRSGRVRLVGNFRNSHLPGKR